MGNTEGKWKIFVTKAELSYIAGFLDGDGCIMLQVFYQDSRNSSFLSWLKEKLEFGYIRARNDGMSEYTIVGVDAVSRILKILKPYIRLKEKQVNLALEVLKEMPGQGRKMTPEKLLGLSGKVGGFLHLNYSKKRTNTSVKVEEFLKSKNLL